MEERRRGSGEGAARALEPAHAEAEERMRQAAGQRIQATGGVVDGQHEWGAPESSAPCFFRAPCRLPAVVHELCQLHFCEKFENICVSLDGSKSA